MTAVRVTGHARTEREKSKANAGSAIIVGMLSLDDESVLRLVDTVLKELALRGTMYAGRRAPEGDADSFVLQTGEEGRLRLRLPELDSANSIETFIAQAQAHLGQVFRRPVPLCPLHDHALVGRTDGGKIEWVCPDGPWRCAIGDYEELPWPQLDVRSLAPIPRIRAP